MCKVIALTNTAKLKDVETAVNAVHKHITKSERDGFGWAIQGDKGVFGERTTLKEFKFRHDKNQFAIKLPIIKPTYNQFGALSSKRGAGIFHGRTSTNDATLLNTHPVQRNGWTLIHNGVVHNTGEKYDMLTTNDTEHLVHYLSTTGITGIETHLTGYFAIAALDPNGRLHVCRDNIARLHVAWVPKLESYMFATTPDLISDICKQLKLKVGPIDVVQDNIYMIFEGNELVHQQTISPRGYTQVEANFMSKSLKYLDDDKTYNNRVYTYETPSERVSGGSNYESADYDSYLEELDALDDSYEIYLYDKQIDILEFRKLDECTRMQCVITRADGTVVECETYAAGAV
jgi:predicted glutamine amidotransferase